MERSVVLNYFYGATILFLFLLFPLFSLDHSGMMIPIPQYPIYSATCDLFGIHQVGYYLDESKGWDSSVEELERSLEEATLNGIVVNSLVLINPGNPTGEVLSKESVKVSKA
jgi:alanine transaminase